MLVSGRVVDLVVPRVVFHSNPRSHGPPVAASEIETGLGDLRRSLVIIKPTNDQYFDRRQKSMAMLFFPNPPQKQKNKLHSPSCDPTTLDAKFGISAIGLMMASSNRPNGLGILIRATPFGVVGRSVAVEGRSAASLRAKPHGEVKCFFKAILS